MKKFLIITLFVFGLTVFAHKTEAINNYGYYDGGYQNTYAQPSTNSYMPTNYTYQNATATSTSYGGYGGYNNGGYYNQPVSSYYYNAPLIWRMPSLLPGYTSYNGYNTGYNGGYTGGYTNYANPNNNQYYNNYNNGMSYQQPQYYNQPSTFGWRY
jgi:hypothetical protein